MCELHGGSGNSVNYVNDYAYGDHVAHCDYYSDIDCGPSFIRRPSSPSTVSPLPRNHKETKIDNEVIGSRQREGLSVISESLEGTQCVDNMLTRESLDSVMNDFVPVDKTLSVTLHPVNPWTADPTPALLRTKMQQGVSNKVNHGNNARTSPRTVASLPNHFGREMLKNKMTNHGTGYHACGIDISPGRGTPPMQYPGFDIQSNPETVIRVSSDEYLVAPPPLAHNKTNFGTSMNHNLAALPPGECPEHVSAQDPPAGDRDNVPQDSADLFLPTHESTIDNFYPKLSREAVEEHSDRIHRLWPHPTEEAFKQFPEFCRVYSKIKSYNLPNALGARIPVKSGLNIQQWQRHLGNYHDREICSYLQFGWPLGYSGTQTPQSVDYNHPSGENFKHHIQEFIQVELGHEAILGPFHKEPFYPWTRRSPIMSRPKKDSDKRRIIIDLTFPQGHGVNQGIDIHAVLGKDITYSLPTIKDLTTRLQLLGPGAWIWVADLQRAYRQLRVDPLDTPFLGLQLDNNIFIDLCPSFGCRSSSAACQRTSNAVVYIMGCAGHVILAYLDDYIGCCATEREANLSYQHFQALLQQLGLQLAPGKCQPPSTKVTWLGYTVNTNTMEISIPDSKLQEVLAECEKWERRVRATKQQLQSLVGKILHVAECVRHGRKFTGRMLATLREMKDRNWTTLNPGFKADIAWFKQYAVRANGVSIFATTLDYYVIECDACLTGAGGNSNEHFYTWKFTATHTSRYKLIHQLEAINILVALRTLMPARPIKGAGILIYTDNISSSFALSTGKTKDPVLSACARQIWLEAAVRDVEVKIVHKHGALIPLADALSRVHTDPSKESYIQEEVQKRGISRLPPVLNGYHFFNDNL